MEILSGRNLFLSTNLWRQNVLFLLYYLNVMPPVFYSQKRHQYHESDVKFLPLFPGKRTRVTPVWAERLSDRTDKARARPWNDAAILWLLPPTVWKSRHYWSPAPEGLKLENSWLGPPNIFLQSLFTHSHVPRCTASLFTQGLQKYSLGSVSVQTHNKRLDYVGNVEETRCILMLVSANADVFLTRSR